jgi:MOSC domain-containing protein YiiM
LEQTLVGAQLQVGTARLGVRSPIERCVTVNYHPLGETSDPRILRFLSEQRNAWMGIYCDVLEPGTASVGDPLILL